MTPKTRVTAGEVLVLGDLPQSPSTLRYVVRVGVDARGVSEDDWILLDGSPQARGGNRVELMRGYLSRGEYLVRVGFADSDMRPYAQETFNLSVQPSPQIESSDRK